MKSRAQRTPVTWIHRATVFVWIIAGVFAAALVLSVCAWRNPWSIRSIDAGSTSAQELESIAGSHTPYVEIKGINITFTGFYEKAEDGTVCSYCYMGTVGNDNILIDMPVNDGGALAQDGSAEGSIIRNTTIEGQAVISDDMKKWLADDENLEVGDYRSKYSVSAAEFHVYHSDQEKVRIYQAMLLVLAAGFAATGVILWSEARSARNERSL